jgi:exosome complex exonuclease DIS3/RRP44
MVLGYSCPSKSHSYGQLLKASETDSSFLRLGLEGLVMFKRDTQFDAENYTISVPSSDIGRPDVTISVFDKVTVRIEVEKDKNTQRGRVKMTLVSPVDSRAL